MRLTLFHNWFARKVNIIISSSVVGKPEGKTQLGRPRRRWEDYIKMDLKEITTFFRLRIVSSDSLL
jgi:hypothetical protein